MSAARIDKAPLFELLRYSPHEGQWAVHKSRARFRALACGTRWGKSTAAAMEGVCALLEPREKPSMGWAVAPTVELTKFVMDRIRIAMIEHIPHRVLIDDTRTSRFVVKNLAGGTSELRAKSADNPTSLLGEALDWLVLDEASKLRGELWESYLAPRLVDRRGWALMISTPRGLDWFFDAWRKGQPGRHADPEYQSWRAPTTDNPHLSAAVIESERKRLSPAAFAQEYLAVFEGEKDLPCEICNGPSFDAPGVLVSPDLALEPHCPACDGYVDAQGRTIVGRHPDGRPHLFLIDGGPGLRGLERQTGRASAHVIKIPARHCDVNVGFEEFEESAFPARAF